MKYINLILCFFLGSCSTLSNPFRNSPPNQEPNPQPKIVDPIDLIIEGNSTTEITEQSHIKPFLAILIAVLVICLLPFLVVKAKPHAQKLHKWLKKKLQDRKERKKLDKHED